jgi:HD superfamily phosphodiesterase
LLYHDIGRPFNKEWHTYESAKIIEEYNLFLKSEIPQKYIRILLGVIKHHLFFGTIFTGESSYLGATILLRDQSLKPIWESKEEIDLFFQILLLFTVIDILGYDYSKIFDHYLYYYLKIKKIYKMVSNLLELSKIQRKKRTLYFLSLIN